MNKLYCLIILFITSGVCNAQYNLVPNPSFEVFDTCPHNPSKIHYAAPWTNPLTSSPDYMNACDTSFNHQFGVPANYLGYEPARTGVAYALIVTYINDPNPLGNNYREYIQVELTDSLLSGEDYCIRLYVSAGDSNGYVTNNLGVYFSPVHIQVVCPFSCVMPYTPQFENPMTNNLNSKNGWTEVAGTYMATGGEKFIVIGNFKDSSSTIATPTGWLTGPKSIYACYYIDDVMVIPCDSLTGINENIYNNEYTLYPNPFSDQLHITTKTNQPITVFLYDITSRKIFNKPFTTSTTINTEQLTKGIYFYEVRNKNGVIKKGKVVKD